MEITEATPDKLIRGVNLVACRIAEATNVLQVEDEPECEPFRPRLDRSPAWLPDAAKDVTRGADREVRSGRLLIESEGRPEHHAALVVLCADYPPTPTLDHFYRHNYGFLT